jgi:integrase
MTAQDRLMAALILVFGQPTHKVIALQWKDITIHDAAQAITLGKHPVILEYPLDELVVAVSQSVANRQTAANAITPWVFPGYRPGSHLNANHVRIRLRKLGFPSLSLSQFGCHPGVIYDRRVRNLDSAASLLPRRM